MSIETIMYMTHNEFVDFIKESHSHNSHELKDYLKTTFNIQTDFCVSIEEDDEVFYNVIQFEKELKDDKTT